MNKSWIAILLGPTGLSYITLGDLVTRNALDLLNGEPPRAEALLGIQPTLEEARTAFREFQKKMVGIQAQSDKSSEGQRHRGTEENG